MTDHRPAAPGAPSSSPSSTPLSQRYPTVASDFIAPSQTQLAAFSSRQFQQQQKEQRGKVQRDENRVHDSPQHVHKRARYGEGGSASALGSDHGGPAAAASTSTLPPPPQPVQPASRPVNTEDASDSITLMSKFLEDDDDIDADMFDRLTQEAERQKQQRRAIELISEPAMTTTVTTSHPATHSTLTPTAAAPSIPPSQSPSISAPGGPAAAAAATATAATARRRFTLPISIPADDMNEHRHSQISTYQSQAVAATMAPLHPIQPIPAKYESASSSSAFPSILSQSQPRSSQSVVILPPRRSPSPSASSSAGSMSGSSGVVSYRVELAVPGEGQTPRLIERVYPGPVGRLRTRVKTEEMGVMGVDGVTMKTKPEPTSKSSTSPIYELIDSDSASPVIGSDDADFELSSWVSMMDECRLTMPTREEIMNERMFPYEQHSHTPNRSPAASSQWSHNLHFLSAPSLIHRQKIPLLHVLIVSQALYGSGDARVRLKDPYGELDASVSRDVMQRWAGSIHIHACMKLINVTLFHAGSQPSQRVLIITPHNVQRIWRHVEHRMSSDEANMHESGAG